MVGNNLQCHEQTTHNNAPTTLASVAQSHTTDSRGDESKGIEFPNVSGRYDNEIVAGECP